MISPQNSRLGLAALTKRVGLLDRPDSPDGELIKYRVCIWLLWVLNKPSFCFQCLTNLILLFCQWDDPHVVPADMSLELSELFSRELTRVTLMLLLRPSVFYSIY